MNIRDKLNDSGLMLEYALKNGILNIDTIQMQIEIMERNKYLNMHKYKVWQATNGYWYTELPPLTGEGKRKLVKKKKREDIDNCIIDFYEDKFGTPTFNKCFRDWMNQRLERKEITKVSHERYDYEYNRAFKNHEINNLKVDAISECYLEDFILDLIAKGNVTIKEFGLIKVIISGVIKYSKKHGYTDINISTFFSELEISQKSFCVKEKKKQVFTENERTKVVEEIRNNPSIINYGLLLAFQTGIRVGELAALKPEDIEGQWLHIQRQEISYKDNGRKITEVVEYTKTKAGNRRIALPKSALDTISKIKEINPDGEYLLMRKGKRITRNNYEYAIYTLCSKSGVEKKSMHKIRKTYGTMLLNSGADDIFVTNQMGHTNVNTTRSYYYYMDKEKTDYLDQVENAILI